MKPAFTSEASAGLLKKKESLMQVGNDFDDIDFSLMRDGDTALVLADGGKWTRLWRRGRNLRISVPLLQAALTAEERLALGGIVPGVGV